MPFKIHLNRICGGYSDFAWLLQWPFSFLVSSLGASASTPCQITHELFIIWNLAGLQNARFCEGLPIFLRFVSAKAKPNIYSAELLPGSEGKHRFFFKVLFCFHEKSDFKFSYGDLPKISLNCKTAVLQIFLNFETEILSSQRECSFCCADISLTVRKLLLI